MKKNFKPHSGKIAVFAGATALVALTCQSHAQSADALIDKLVDKGILTSGKEAQELREESDQDYMKAFQAKTGMPDWVTGYKIGGSFRGRFEQFTSENPNFIARTRLRYRLLVGMTSFQMKVKSGDRLSTGLRRPLSGWCHGQSHFPTMAPFKMTPPRRICGSTRRMANGRRR